jgi:hypothetical protein
MGWWSPAVQKLVVGAVASATVGEVARPLVEEVGKRVKRLGERLFGDEASGPADVGALDPERTARAITRGAISAVVPGLASEPRKKGKSGTYKCTCTGGAGEACACGSQETAEAGAWVPGPIPWIPGGDDDDKRRRRRSRKRAESRANMRLGEVVKRLEAQIAASTGQLRDELKKKIGATRRLRASLPGLAPQQVQKVAEQPPEWLERVLEKLTDSRAAPAPAAPPAQQFVVPFSPYAPAFAPPYPWAAPPPAAPAPAPAPPPAAPAAPTSPAAPQDDFSEFFESASAPANDDFWAAADVLAEQSLAGAPAVFVDPDVSGVLDDDDDDEAGEYDDDEAGGDDDEAGEYDDDEAGGDDDDETGEYDDDDEAGEYDDDEAGGDDDDEAGEYDDDEAGEYDDVDDAIAGAEVCGSCR